MEPIRNPTLGKLSPARRPRARYRLNDPLGSSSDRRPDGPGKVVSDGQYRDAGGYPGRSLAYTLDRHRTADDRAVEAMLASVRAPCTASQLASGLDWTLDRTIDALEHLEAAVERRSNDSGVGDSERAFA
jgi:hypothetical protein